MRLKFASSAKPGEAHSSHESNLAREAAQNSGQIHTSPDAATEEARNWHRVPRYKQFVLAVVFLATFLLSDGSSTASRAWEGAPPWYLPVALLLLLGGMSSSADTALFRISRRQILEIGAQTVSVVAAIWLLFGFPPAIPYQPLYLLFHRQKSREVRES